MAIDSTGNRASEIDEIMNDEERLRRVMGFIESSIDYLSDRHDELLEENPDCGYAYAVLKRLAQKASKQ